MTLSAIQDRDALQGPLAIAVATHEAAGDLAGLIGFVGNDKQQGVVVIPYASSALAYCAGGTALFRGLVVIEPRSDHISRQSFEAWVEKSIAPYLAPGSGRINL